MPKVALLITTLAFAVSSAYVFRQTDTQLECTSRKGAWYADENDCTKFYMCIMDQARLLQCPDGEFFDAKQKSCRTGSCKTVETEQSADAGHIVDKIMKQSKVVVGCGLYADGVIWASDDSAGNTYMQCINGSPVLRTCPTGLIFSNQANYCMNPCSAGDGNENVMDPNNNSSYYECIGNVVQGNTPTACAADQSFFQSLVGIGVYTGYAEGCIDADIVDTCPPNAFANVPVYPLDTVTGTISCQIPGLTSTPMTNFYVECYQGTGSLQKCLEGYIIYNGGCMNLSLECTAGEVSCIC